MDGLCRLTTEAHPPPLDLSWHDFFASTGVLSFAKSRAVIVYIKCGVVEPAVMPYLFNGHPRLVISLIIFMKFSLLEKELCLWLGFRFLIHELS